MTWELFIGVSVFLYSISVLLQRVLLKESNSYPIAYSLVFQLVNAVLIGLFAVATGQWELPPLGPLLLNLLLMGALYAVANICIFTALKKMEASKFTILFASRGFFTILASSLLLREVLSTTQFIGAILIFSGIVVINLHSRKLKFEKSDILAFIAAIGFGLANTNDRVLLSQMNVYVFCVLSFLLPTVLIAVAYPRELKNLHVFLQPKLFTKMMLLCVIYAASAVSFFIALQIAPNSSQIAAINLTSVIFIVLLAIVFLKERASLAKKILGALLSFVGLLLVR